MKKNTKTSRKKLFLKTFFETTSNSLIKIDKKKIFQACKILGDLKSKKARLFIMGSGGGAGHASHAVNDFRKIAQIESYCPTDNASELTARINDEGWETCFKEWLKISKLNQNDTLLVFSVGGGCQKRKISMNLVNAMKYAKTRKSKIIAITGRDGGAAKKLANVLILIHLDEYKYVTPVVESLQAFVWHCMVSFPGVQAKKTKW